MMVADGFTVHGPSGPLVGPLGSSVVLPCYVVEHLPMEDLEVAWRRADSDTLVHLYQDAEDEGRYTCTVHTQQDSGEIVVQIKHEHLIVSGSDQFVSAYDGEDVTLNCSVETHVPLEDIEASWIRTDGDIMVLLFQNNETLPEAADKRYRDRAEFFTAEIPEGNFSLRLKSVRTEDKGVYMCQVFAGGLSANATAVLEQLGFSSWHIAVLFFCFAAGFGDVLLLCLLIYCRSNNTAPSNKIWNLQLSLVFCPNICLFFAFILWGLTEGSLHETVSCSSLYILRPVMLIWALPYLKYLQDNLKTWIKIFKIIIELVVFTVVVYSVIFENGWRKSAHDSNNHRRAVYIMSFGCFVLVCLILCGLQRLVIILRHRSQAWERRASQFFPILGAFKMLNFLVWLFTVNMFQLVLFITSFDIASLDLFIVGIVQSLLLICILFLPRLQAKFKFLSHSWIILLSIITITLLDIILLIYVLLTTLKREKEYLEWTSVILFIEVLKIIVVFKETVQVAEWSVVQRQGQQIETSQQGSNALHLCNEIMYMFGAVGLVLLSCVTLTAELILKARNGERVVKDLRVIVFPSESVFALYWLVLQMHAYWKIVTTRFTHNQSNSSCLRKTSENHEMDNLSAPNTAVSKTPI
ncbi:hypothetical protein QQF64_025517 [Cirrhinus molitorella]|uniref:Ig-like domain-containing protein n=1 Tax=Cirrhinus molitorella TaxID=172907 RepID=A0ABR3NPK7_9TELE